MRKWMMMLLILGLLTVPVLGAEAEAEAVLEGVPQEVRESPGITLRGPKGEVHLDHGVIVAQRHIHMPPEEAAARGLTDGQVVRLKMFTARPLVFDDVVVRVDPSFTPRVHIDFDEANACAYQSGDFGMIIRG